MLDLFTVDAVILVKERLLGRPIRVLLQRFHGFYEFYTITDTSGQSGPYEVTPDGSLYDHDLRQLWLILQYT